VETMNKCAPAPMRNSLRSTAWRTFRTVGRIVSATGRVVGAPLVGALEEGTHKGCPYETRESQAAHGDFEWRGNRWATIGLLSVSLLALSSCGKVKATSDSAPAITVGVTKVTRKSLQRQITLSSELVPFQEIDVYAKESGFVKKLLVDYGTRVQAGQLMAVLEIPELEAQLQEDQAGIKNSSDQVNRANHQLQRYQAQSKVLHLEYTRMNGVFQSQPGLIAQQEVDDAQGKDMAAASEVDAAQSNLEGAQSSLLVSRSKLIHDQALYAYSRITAPFAGVVTQRYANLGMLMQGGTTSSTQAMPLVRLSQDDLYRLVIPVPESSVRFIRVGDPVQVSVPALNRSFPGKVARFSVDVQQDTRTMHTEVDVSNPGRLLMPGMYAETMLTLEARNNVLSVPLEAVNHEGDQTTVYVVDHDGRVVDQVVTLGLQTSTDAEIISGLDEGGLVIVSDRSGLKPCEEVHPQAVQMLQYKGAGQE
jgi:RND family efflux transporter MFP subunit